MGNLNFDANTVEPQADLSPIPAGEYVMTIVASEMKYTKSGDGQYLLLEMQVLEGEYNGRLIWDRLNLINNNRTAVEISNRTLSSICHATGKLKVADSSELHGIPMLVRVNVRSAENGYEAANDVKRYKTLKQDAPAAQQSVQRNQQQEPFPSRQQTAVAAVTNDDIPW